MNEAGFKRRGRSYRKISENGDQAALDFTSRPILLSNPPNIIRFRADFGIVSLPFVDWLLRGSGGCRLGEFIGFEYAIVREILIPPQEFWSGTGSPRIDSTWAFAEPEERDECGPALVNLLSDVVIPELSMLVNRREILRRMKDSSSPKRLSPGRIPEFYYVLLIIDEGPSAEVEQYLQKIESLEAELEFSAEFVPWARKRLAEHEYRRY
jgi:hypothetical protein